MNLLSYVSCLIPPMQYLQPDIVFVFLSVYNNPHAKHSKPKIPNQRSETTIAKRTTANRCASNSLVRVTPWQTKLYSTKVYLRQITPQKPTCH